MACRLYMLLHKRQLLISKYDTLLSWRSICHSTAYVWHGCTHFTVSELQFRKLVEGFRWICNELNISPLKTNHKRVREKLTQQSTCLPRCGVLGWALTPHRGTWGEAPWMVEGCCDASPLCVSLYRMKNKEAELGAVVLHISYLRKTVQQYFGREWRAEKQ